jgi:hypothetical protein
MQTTVETGTGTMLEKHGSLLLLLWYKAKTVYHINAQQGCKDPYFCLMPPRAAVLNAASSAVR